MYPPPPDYLVERRLLTRKLSFWRIAAFGALIVAVLVAGWRLAGDRSHIGAHIARVTIKGVIDRAESQFQRLCDCLCVADVGWVPYPMPGDAH